MGKVVQFLCAPTNHLGPFSFSKQSYACLFIPSYPSAALGSALRSQKVSWPTLMYHPPQAGHTLGVSPYGVSQCHRKRNKRFSLSRMLGTLGISHCPERASSCVQLWQPLPLSLMVMAHLTSTSPASLLLAGVISKVNSLQTSLCLEL